MPEGSGARHAGVSRFARLASLVRVTLGRSSLVIFFTLTLQGGCTESFEVLTTQASVTPWKECDAALDQG
jgi:hypothetical protein